MRKIRLKYGILMALAMVLSACGGKAGRVVGNVSKVSGRVLVIHCYDSLFHCYSDYDRVFSQSLKYSGTDADVRNVYHAGIEKYGGADYRSQLSALAEEGWRPDVLCLLGDKVLEGFIQGQFSACLSVLDSIPTVASGISCPDWDNIRRHPEMAVQCDIIDIGTNMALIRSMSDLHFIQTELDYGPADMRLRSLLNEAASIPPYLNNSDFHIRETMKNTLEQNPDSVLVTVVSMENRYASNPYGSPDAFIRHVRQNSGRSSYLALKNDVYSDLLLNNSLTPQFTAIRDVFDDGTRRVLCGYFASYETIASDQADYVSRILHGSKPGSLPVRNHARGYYMDWSAMELVGGMKYRDWAAGNNPAGISFSISNASFEVRHPSLFTVLSIVGLLLAVGLLTAVQVFMFSGAKRRSQKAERILKLERRLFDKVLAGVSCTIISDTSDLLPFKDRVHPDDRDVFNGLLAYLTGGELPDEDQLRLYDAESDEFHWFQFRHTDAAEHSMAGILIDVNDNVNRIHSLQDVELLAREVTGKENFLMNVSHEIRTPLNGIVGFSQLIATDDGRMTQEELDYLCGVIIENTSLLSEKIEDILQYTRLESGRVEFVMADTDIPQLVREVFMNWSARVPNGVHFTLAEGRASVFANVDAERLSNVLGHYIRNAFMFVRGGNVILGWTYDINEDKVTIYVEDDGPGMSPRKQMQVFSLFWKDDMFQTGTGLGLTISKLYTEKMGGQVGLSSREGLGSRLSSTFKAWIHE